jgi:hypothetical protein
MTDPKITRRQIIKGAAAWAPLAPWASRRQRSLTKVTAARDERESGGTSST